MMPRMAADSTSSTRLASARAGWIVASRMMAVFRGLDIRGDGMRREGGFSMFPGVLFLRQEKGEECFAHGRWHSGGAAEPDDGAELGIELRRLAIDDVTLERGGGIRREAVEAGQRPFDGFGAEVDSAGARKIGD